MRSYAIYNGRMIDITETCLSPKDRGFLLGDAVFETLRSYSGHLPFWDLHIERLRHGMSQLGFSFTGIDFENMAEKAKDLIDRNVIRDVYLRVTVSRGIMCSGLLPEWGKGEPNWVIFTKPLSPDLEYNRKKGINAIISSIRKHSSSPVARLKTANYLDMIMAKREAFLNGALEAVLLDERGHVAETSTANLFWVNNGMLLTPSLDMPILPGIVRRKLLEIVNRLGIPCQEGVYVLRSLIESDEAFITNSLCEVTPLTSINKQDIADGRPGIVTLRLQAEYRKSILKNIQDI